MTSKIVPQLKIKDPSKAPFVSPPKFMQRSIAVGMIFFFLGSGTPVQVYGAESFQISPKSTEESPTVSNNRTRISRSLLEMTSLPDIFLDSAPFIVDTLIPSESIYFQPGIGMDEKTGMPYDHIRIRLTKGQIGERGNYAAASKISLLIPYLLGVMTRQPVFEKAKLTPEQATNLLENCLKTLRRYRVEYPDFDGFLAWSDIRSNGSIVPAWYKMPSLDNGQMSWALASVVAALEDSADPRQKQMAKMADNFLKSQNYGKFYDPKKKLMHGTIQYNPVNKTWSGDKTYYLNDMFEGILAVLWGIVHGQIPEDAWNNLEIHGIDYVTSDGQVITTLRGYRASFHEHWGLIFLPLMKSSLAPLYQNYLYIQADYARSHGLPGFVSTSYDTNGNYRQMGIPAIASQPVDRSDVAVIFATALSMLISPSTGIKWLQNIMNFRGIMTPYGAVESVAHDGYADVMTADGKGLTLVAASGGVVNQTEKYLKRRKVPGTNITMYDKLMQLLESKYQQMLKARNGLAVQMPSKPYPMPSLNQIHVEVKSIPQAGEEYNISQHVQPGHLHGKNVTTIGLPTLEDDLAPGKDFSFHYQISSDLSYFDQWAFRGTYLDQTMGISGMKYISLSLPVETPPVLFDLEIKSDDIVLTHCTIDTQHPGILSEDGKWKTYVEKITLIPESDYKPVDYFSVTMHDPSYLFGEHLIHGRSGDIRIRNIRLTRENPLQPKATHFELAKIKAPVLGDVEVIQYWRTSHGTLDVGKDDWLQNYHFPGKRGWKGGYLPYIALDKFRFFHIKARNLSRKCNCFYAEIKNEEQQIMGKKFPVKMASNRKWYTFESELPEDVKVPLNYLAFSDPLGDFEISSISFSDISANRSDNLVVIDRRTSVKCEEACSISDH